MRFFAINRSEMGISMKLALAVWNPLWEAKEENKERAEQLIEKAARYGNSLILFPEMTLTGYSMNIDKIGENRKNSSTCRFFQRLSKKHRIAVGFGYAVVTDGKTDCCGENCFAIVKDGMILGSYTKIHPFSFAGEHRIYQGGDRLCQVKLDDMTFGLYICYDLRFPEVFRVAAKHCQVMTVIASWPEERKSQWETLLCARAIENQCYVIGVNRTGEGNHIIYPENGSFVFDPYGNRVLLEERDGLLLCEINQDMVYECRHTFPFLQDRRPELYERFENGKKD